MNSNAVVTFRRLPFNFGTKRKLTVLIDGKPRVKLKHQQSDSIELPPGTHTFGASMDSCSAPPLTIDLSDGETVTVECGAQDFLRAFLFMFISPGNVFTLTRTDDPSAG